MAELGTLSTQRLRRDRGSGRGLQASHIPTSAYGAGSRSTLSIPPSAGNRTFTPAPIPKTVEDQTMNSVLGFMGNLANAVQDYQRREAEYLANEAALAYQTKLRNAFNGYEDAQGRWITGYGALQGKQATEGYGAYEKAANDEMENVLRGMEPRVKQRAIFQLQGAKNQYMGKAATHRSAEMQKEIEAQKFRTLQGITQQIADDPFSIDKIIPETKSSLRMDFHRQFTDPEEAAKAWNEVMADSLKIMYYNIALAPIDSRLSVQQQLQQEAANYTSAANVANTAYKLVFEKEISDPGKKAEVLRSLKAHEHEGRTARNSVFSRLETQAQNDIKAYQQANEALAEARVAERDPITGAPNLYTRQEIAEFMSENPPRWTPAYTRTYLNTYYGNEIKAPSQTVIRREMQRVDRAKANGWIDPETDQRLMPGWTLGMSGLGYGGHEVVNDYYKRMRNEQETKEESAALDIIRTETRGETYQQGLFSRQLDMYTWEAEQFVRDNIATLGFEKTVREARIRHNMYRTEINFRNKQSISPVTNIAITNHDDIIQAVAILNNLLAQDPPGITTEQYEEEKSRIEGFITLLEEERKHLQWVADPESRQNRANRP